MIFTIKVLCFILGFCVCVLALVLGETYHLSGGGGIVQCG